MYETNLLIHNFPPKYFTQSSAPESDENRGGKYSNHETKGTFLSSSNDGAGQDPEPLLPAPFPLLQFLVYAALARRILCRAQVVIKSDFCFSVSSRSWTPNVHSPFLAAHSTSAGPKRTKRSRANCQKNQRVLAQRALLMNEKRNEKLSAVMPSQGNNRSQLHNR